MYLCFALNECVAIEIIILLSDVIAYLVAVVSFFLLLLSFYLTTVNGPEFVINLIAHHLLVKHSRKQTDKEISLISQYFFMITLIGWCLFLGQFWDSHTKKNICPQDPVKAVIFSFFKRANQHFR